MDFKKQAIEKINKEAEETKHPLSKMLSMQIIDNISDNDRAKKVLEEGKTLAGCQKALDNFAEKRKENNKSFVSPDEAEKIIFDYFEFAKESKTEENQKLNIADFL